MSRLKKGDTIKCLSSEEADFYCGELRRDGYFIETLYIPCEMSYNILIIKDLREAADDREEKQKAINALKISVPITAMTQEEFKDYIQTLNKIMDWLEQEPILDKIRAEIEKLEYLNIEDGSDGYDKYIEQYEVLKIIDKYRAEK